MAELKSNSITAAPAAPHTIRSARHAIASGEISAVALADSYYTTIAAEDPKIHAWLAFSRERATAQAHRIDELVQSGDLADTEALPLAGVPIGIKDVLVMQRSAQPPPARKSWKTIVRPTMPLRWQSWRLPAPSCSASSTATSSPWAPRTKTPPTARCTIRALSIAFPAARAVAPPPPSPPTWPSPRSAPIPEAPFASPHRSAESSACCQPMAASRATASSPLPLRSTASVPSPTPSRCRHPARCARRSRSHGRDQRRSSPCPTTPPRSTRP